MGVPSFLFWRRYLRRPLGIGAIAPSSRSLARAMVVALAPAPGETVVELGPGTGVFTRALLEAGVDRETLLLVEFDSEFARHLRTILPGVEVIEADARKLPDILHRRGLSGTPKLLSGLPLRSMPDPIRNDIGRAMTAALLPGGNLVQFTYFAAPPLPEDAAAGLDVERLGFIWRNLPPAFVWRYTKPPVATKIQLMLPALDPASVPATTGSDYPPEFRSPVEAGERRRLGDATGLANFGVNLVRLPPGTASSQRHWHTRQDEFVFILHGEATLVSDACEQVLGPGMAAGFAAGTRDGHHLLNRSHADVVFIEVGDRTPGDEGEYPDLDMIWRTVDGDQRYMYLHRDGTPY